MSESFDVNQGQHHSAGGDACFSEGGKERLYKLNVQQNQNVLVNPFVSAIYL